MTPEQIVDSNRIINVRHVMINNKFGRYWNTARFCIMAVTDLRARSGPFNTPWETPTDPMFALPKFRYIPDSLNDIMDERAIELNEIAKSTGRQIMHMWSGGIDSTAVLAAFIRNLSEADLQNIVVVLSIDSITENPYFYEKFIRGKLRCMSYLEYNMTDEALSNNIMLNGDPADCLFGPSISMYGSLIPSGGHLAPFKRNLKQIEQSITQYGNRDNIIQLRNIPNFGQWYTLKITKNLMAAAPDGVETISDWWWWHYMNFKWEFSIWRALMRRRCGGSENGPISPENIKSYVENTFYNTERFQLWSYSNLRNHVINNDISTHKLAIKKYIYELDKNESYLTQKGKVMSIPVYDHSMYYDIRKPFMWGHDWVGYYDNEHPELVAECARRLESYKG